MIFWAKPGVEQRGGAGAASVDGASSATKSTRRTTDVYFKDFQAVTVAVVGADGGIWATMGTCGSC